MNETRIDVKGRKEFEELTTFLTFHQFLYKIGEEKTFDVEKLAEVNEQFLLIENNKIEEFKVLYCLFKDLKANSGVIEDKPVKEKRPMGDDTALRLVKEELLLAGIEDEEESPFQFRKEEEAENQDQPLEEVFYDKKGREKKKKKEKKEKAAKKQKSTGFKVFLLLFWIIIVIILALMFILIR